MKREKDYLEIRTNELKDQQEKVKAEVGHFHVLNLLTNLISSFLVRNYERAEHEVGATGDRTARPSGQIGAHQTRGKCLWEPNWHLH